jgi:putative aldouronate transport system substrate-binding protein
MRKKARILSIILSFLLLLSFTGCVTNKNDESTTTSESGEIAKEEQKTTEEPISFTIMAQKDVEHNDFAEMIVFKEMEEKFGYKIEWILVDTQSFGEKRNLSLASNSYPDAFWNGGFSAGDLVKYGDQGIFIKLNDLINANAPNIKSVFDEYDDVKFSVMSPDGSIYGIPTVQEPKTSYMKWLNTKWLSNLGMDVPTTTEEYYNVLKAFKEEDPNQNGLNDEIPVTNLNPGDLREMNFILGAWGLSNRGATAPLIDEGEDGKIRFYPADPRYKEVLEYLAKMFKEGLLDNDIFSHQRAQALKKGIDGLVGSVTLANANTQYERPEEEYSLLSPLTGPYGDNVCSGALSHVLSQGAFVITDNCKNADKLMSWIDYFYGPEGATLMRVGVEGVTYTKVNEDGVEYIVYTDDVMDNPLKEGYYFPWVRLNAPYYNMYCAMTKEIYTRFKESERIIAASHPGKVWNMFVLTPEEQEIINEVSSDVNKYVTEMNARFIIGEEPIDAFDRYIDELKKMRYEKIVEVYQKAYDRINK